MANFSLLLESTGDALLLESGDRLLLESSTGGATVGSLFWWVRYSEALSALALWVWMYGDVVR